MILAGDGQASMHAAANVLISGGLIGLPTETVYGLAADAENPQAVAKIFQTKGRPADHPLIVHVYDFAAVPHFASEVPDFARALMHAFWPGPLTVILPRRPEVAAAAAGGQSTVGLRCPSHPVARNLLKQLRPGAGALGEIHGLAAPSANLFGRVSPTTAQHVRDELGDDLLVLDGGPCHVGIESTIVDCSRGQPVLLRPGAITAAQLEAVCGLPVVGPDALSDVLPAAPKASGTLASHYAPSAKVRLLDAQGLRSALAERSQTSGQVAVWWRSAPLPSAAGLSVQAMPEQADVAAYELFATLRAFDALGVQEIWIEPPPADPEWDGVRDRLQRAAF